MKKSHKQISLNELQEIAKEQHKRAANTANVANDKIEIETALNGYNNAILLYNIIIRKDLMFVNELIEVIVELADYYVKIDLLDQSDQMLKQALNVFFDKYPSEYDEKGVDSSEYVRNQIIFKLDFNRRTKSNKTALVVRKKSDRLNENELIVDNSNKNF